ncbi:hypothetical protein AAHN97_12390 [Chitinophaga niabensis]|uniref:hypothetical protein n=1 Tax=Chitinophaga niabensis TaxID=536979 RepID=UPI0031BA8B0D
MHADFYQYFQFLSLLVALICYRGLKAYSIQAFVPLIMIANIAETAGTNYHAFAGLDNDFIYNLYLLFSTPLRLYLFGKMLDLKQNEKSTFLFITILCMLILVLNYFFYQGINVFNTISAILVEIISIIFSCFVLLRMAVQQNMETNLLQEPYFWINAASLLFGLMSLVVLGLVPYIRGNHIELFGMSMYSLILAIVNIILYSAYTYSFILCRIQRAR